MTLLGAMNVDTLHLGRLDLGHRECEWFRWTSVWIVHSLGVNRRRSYVTIDKAKKGGSLRDARTAREDIQSLTREMVERDMLVLKFAAST